MKLATAGAVLAASGSASAATLIVNSSGLLTGATGVIVGGVSYDVAFKGGTCASVFGACTAANFAFINVDSATAAATALLDQVFIDGPAGQFDSVPTLTIGCTFDTACRAMVPYATIDNSAAGQQSSFQEISADNSYQDVPDTLGSQSLLFNYNTNNTGTRTFAVFSPSVTSTASGAVPESATWAMMLLGFGGLGYTMRRRPRTAARIRFA